jgi:hypothetical protein
MAKTLLIPRPPTRNQTLDSKASPTQPTILHQLHTPEAWIYTNGSLQKGKSIIGAAVIRSPTSITTYIDASGHDETHTILRAELVAIQVALDKYKNDKWIGIFTYSQTSLNEI